MVPINKWGTKADSMLAVAYGNSPSYAVLDLVRYDPELDAIKKRKLGPHDFSDAPKHYWTDKEGNPTLAARKVILALLKKVAKKLGMPPDLENHGAKLTDAMTGSVFSTPLNFWGLTAMKPLKAAYKNNITAALEDLKSIMPNGSIK